MNVTTDSAFSIYEAGTFVVQAHGVTLNARLSITFESMAVTSEAVAAAVMTAFGRELAQNYCRFGSKLHRISYLNRTAIGDLHGLLLFHLPAAHAARVQMWLADWFGRYSGNHPASAYQPKLEYPQSLQDPREALARQWRLLRPMWGNLHPDDFVGSQSLLDRLAVRKDDRSTSPGTMRARFHT